MLGVAQPLAETTYCFYTLKSPCSSVRKDFFASGDLVPF
jgi:hypothetical protein